jgi:hypothetical protein
LVSYKVAYVLAKKGKPFTDGNIIKECMMEAVTELCPEKLNLFKIISLAPNTPLAELRANIHTISCPTSSEVLLAQLQINESYTITYSQIQLARLE